VQEVSRAQVLPEKRGREILEPEQMASRFSLVLSFVSAE